jgi:hypothetical protein
MRTPSIPALLCWAMLAVPVWAQHQRLQPERVMPARPHPRLLLVQHAKPPAVPHASVPARMQAERAQQAKARQNQQKPPAPAAPANPQSAPQQIIRGQGPHNGDWLRNTMKLPPEQQRQLLQQDQRFKQLPPQRQQQLMDRLQKFNSMPPAQQQRVLNRMEMIEHLPPAQQQQARQLFNQFRDMDPARKQMMRRTLRQMRAMPPDARERMLNSPETRSRYSPQEIEMLRGFNSIGFAGQEQ